MTEPRNLKLVCSLYCRPYRTDARIYIEDLPSGARQLVAQYDRGGYGGEAEFIAEIPADWTQAEIVNELILSPMKNRKAPYPSWEVPTRGFGSPVLFRFWKGERPR
jgi:hypothetical protein